MGQKAHPYGLRLGYIKPWKAKWFAPKSFADLLEEDLKLRKLHLKQVYRAQIVLYTHLYSAFQQLEELCLFQMGLYPDTD